MLAIKRARAFVETLTRPAVTRLRALPKQASDFYEYLADDVRVTLAQQRPLDNPPDYVPPPRMRDIWGCLFDPGFWKWLPGYMRNKRIPEYIAYIHDPIKEEREQVKKMTEKVSTTVSEGTKQMAATSDEILKGKPIVSNYAQKWVKQGTEGINAFTSGYRQGQKETYLSEAEIKALREYAEHQAKNHPKSPPSKQEPGPDASSQGKHTTPPQA